MGDFISGDIGSDLDKRMTDHNRPELVLVAEPYAMPLIVDIQDIGLILSPEWIGGCAAADLFEDDLVHYYFHHCIYLLQFVSGIPDSLAGVSSFADSSEGAN